ncbi:leucyl aminopeptidase family protein [Xinfangfangia sp. CPCC 101601]|uniref:Leucyl aminopeptidase family protein n=1 Tax=Pseudogemmobacter lacusdianii TaxID=3069608 RepID=A0ABU0VXK6_9RHOB|nr:leucyl aminopeptidase family protein [Xinfangfangia sp. CPCC 101601]MDQ2066468.1 leucyl aminopeptidase family protein [Xinfangfangia sp. CPCC 101601]
MTSARPAPSFAAADATSKPLHILKPEGLADFLASSPHAGWLRAAGFEAGLGELVLLPGEDGIAGAVAGLGTEKARRRTRFGLARAFAALPEGDWHLEGPLSPAEADEAALAALLFAYRFDRYRPGKAAKAPARIKAPIGVDAARIAAMAAGEMLTRDLINTPAQDMGPAELEAAARSLAAAHGARIEVTTGEALLTQNLPMIHAVGRASPRAPRLIDLHWGNTGPRLTLVGKGVCFDTGGLDIKPSAGMLLMKKDMGGAATVLGLAQMIMTLNLPLQLRVLIPAVENVISGNALMPKDILTSRKGLTVEVNNTDAEGRLVLADALTLASEGGCDVLISMATLTGAARVAVGPDLAPYYTDDESMAQAVEAGAKAGFDPIWRMPFHEAYDPVIEPGIADLDNSPSFGFAGSITAALFLRRFADHPRYMHFDIYGHCPADAPARPKGGAGQGARALLGALPAILEL